VEEVEEKEGSSKKRQTSRYCPIKEKPLLDTGG